MPRVTGLWRPDFLCCIYKIVHSQFNAVYGHTFYGIVSVCAAWYALKKGRNLRNSDRISLITNWHSYPQPLHFLQISHQQNARGLYQRKTKFSSFFVKNFERENNVAHIYVLAKLMMWNVLFFIARTNDLHANIRVMLGCCCRDVLGVM